MRLALYDACFGNYKHYNWACFRPALSPSIPVWLVTRALTRHNTALLFDHLWFLLMLFPKRLIELFSIFVFSILQDSHFWQNKSKIDKSTTTVTKFKKRLKIQLSFRPKSSVYLPRVIYYVENQPTMAKNSWIHRHLHTDQN